MAAPSLIMDPFVIALMLREAVSCAHSYVELSSHMKSFVEKLRSEGVFVSLLDEDGESMIVYGGGESGGALSLYGYWGESGALSDVVYNGRSIAGAKPGPAECG